MWPQRATLGPRDTVYVSNASYGDLPSTGHLATRAACRSCPSTISKRRDNAHVAHNQAGGKKKIFDTGWDIFFRGGPPLGGGGGYEKKWVLQKKLFLPMSHLPHIITVFPPHNMPLLLVGIPLLGSLGY